MGDLIQRLRDPDLVVNFQKLCGVQFLASQSQNAKKVGNGPKSSIAADTTVKRRQNIDVKHESQQKENADKSNELHHVVTNRFLHILFHIGAFLCNEGFYVIVFPFFLHNVDMYLFRCGSYFWCLVMYIGQAAKDVIKEPRPPSPPVARLESRYDTEYGMPSTHAMMGTAMPFAWLFSTYLRYEYPKWLGVSLALMWMSLVCFSRIYLGMHDVWQVIVGILMTLPIVAIGILIVESVDAWLLLSPYAPATLIIVTITLVYLYPAPKDRWTSTRGDTTMILSGSVGCTIGIWLNCRSTGMLPESRFNFPRPVQMPTLQFLGLAILRWIITIAIVVPLRTIMKKIIFAILPRILPKSDVKVSERPLVELPYRYINYGLLGFSVSYIAPIVMKTIGIYSGSPYQ